MNDKIEKTESQHSARILDGKLIADLWKKDIKEGILLFLNQGIIPGLAVILVGENEASKIYVNHKKKACESLGINFNLYTFSSELKEEDLLTCIQNLNQDPSIHGILIQLPLPIPINKMNVLNAVAPEKDVDGFHVQNLGYLLQGRSQFIPATPKGIMKLLQETKILLQGKEVVVIGRSITVGRPMAIALLNEGCTVTLCHSQTQDIKKHSLRADILIIAVGKAHFISGDDIKKGAIVIDVGINRLEDKTIVGDLDFDSVSQRASWVTKVPGGVGPMTIAALLDNVLESLKYQYYKNK